MYCNRNIVLSSQRVIDVHSFVALLFVLLLFVFSRGVGGTGSFESFATKGATCKHLEFHGESIASCRYTRETFDRMMQCCVIDSRIDQSCQRADAQDMHFVIAWTVQGRK